MLPSIDKNNPFSLDKSNEKSDSASINTSGMSLRRQSNSVMDRPLPDERFGKIRIGKEARATQKYLHQELDVKPVIQQQISKQIEAMRDFDKLQLDQVQIAKAKRLDKLKSELEYASKYTEALNQKAYYQTRNIVLKPELEPRPKSGKQYEGFSQFVAEKMQEKKAQFKEVELQLSLRQSLLQSKAQEQHDQSILQSQVLTNSKGFKELLKSEYLTREKHYADLLRSICEKVQGKRQMQMTVEQRIKYLDQQENLLNEGFNKLISIQAEYSEDFNGEKNKLVKMKVAHEMISGRIGFLQNTLNRIFEQIDNQIVQLLVKVQAKELIDQILIANDQADLVQRNSKNQVEMIDIMKQLGKTLMFFDSKQLQDNILDYQQRNNTGQEKSMLRKPNQSMKFNKDKKQLKQKVQNLAQLTNYDDLTHTGIVGFKHFKHLLENNKLDPFFVLRFAPYCEMTERSCHFKGQTDQGNQLIIDFDLKSVIRELLQKIAKETQMDLVDVLAQKHKCILYPYLLTICTDGQEIGMQVGQKTLQQLQRRVHEVLVGLKKKGFLRKITLYDISDEKKENHKVSLGSILDKFYDKLNIQQDRPYIFVVEQFISLLQQVNLTYYSVPESFDEFLSDSDLIKINKIINPSLQTAILLLNQTLQPPKIYFDSPLQCILTIFSNENQVKSIAESLHQISSNKQQQTKIKKMVEEDPELKLKRLRLKKENFVRSIKQIVVKLREIEGYYQRLYFDSQDDRMKQEQIKVFKSMKTYLRDHDIDFIKVSNSITNNPAYDLTKFPSLTYIHNMVLDQQLVYLSGALQQLARRCELSQTPIINSLLTIVEVQIESNVSKLKHFDKERQYKGRKVLFKRYLSRLEKEKNERSAAKMTAKEYVEKNTEQELQFQVDNYQLLTQKQAPAQKTTKFNRDIADAIAARDRNDELMRGFYDDDVQQ